ncbi:MAG: hypothetical protein H0Z35_07620 [Thermoanaerobacteraceae bacterium]|nr:hypothetical protein [Thermoanaerobacteraceae bacterium]
MILMAASSASRASSGVEMGINFTLKEPSTAFFLFLDIGQVVENLSILSLLIFMLSVLESQNYAEAIDWLKDIIKENRPITEG